MSGPLGSQQWMYSTGFYPYEIDQSLRFNDDDAGYLTRTPSVAGNRRTWTFSCWFKRTTTVTDHLLRVNSDNTLVRFDTVYFRVFSGGGLDLKTTQAFRDPSAWYHACVAVDTTQATASDRVKIYINGQQVSDFSTETYPSLNFQTGINDTADHFIGTHSIEVVDGYMAEVYLIDGQALDATSFGEFKSGVWTPKSYSGSYGTNGFYLDFGNSGSLGADSSGNSNNWTPNNLAATDQVLDSPTNNFCTLNPLFQSLITYSEGNLRAYYGGAYAGAGPTMYTGKNQKYYSEELIVARGGDRGISVLDEDGAESIGWIYNGNTFGTLGAGFVMPSYTTGDIIGYAIDGTTNQVQFYKNGVAAGSAWQFSTAKPLSFRTHMGYLYGGSDFVANFGQDSSFAGNKTRQGNTDANGIGDFYYAPPAGYLALCTANLPDPAIDPAQDDVPADYFNTVLYTGNGTTQSITGVGFAPDFAWIKDRSTAYSHRLFDTIRGASKFVQSDNTNAEGSNTETLQSFDSDGFTVGQNASVNGSSDSIVAWNWLADGAGVTNTDGTITSTVSANQKAGFSIVTWTSDGSSSVSTTVGTGLTTAPEMAIIKPRSAVSNWDVYHKDLPSLNYRLKLNGSDAQVDRGTQLFDPQATVFGASQAQFALNGTTVVAYFFHSVEGYSKFGSYAGNGSTDGPFVYTGFRPAFVMIKRADSAHNWIIWDTTRDTYNEFTKFLYPNLSDAEAIGSNVADAVSNGFKLRATSTNRNASGGTYIYMAFAEMPFKYSNAR